MRIIISPAKKMNVDTDSISYRTMPLLLENTEELMCWMKKLTFSEARKLWGCNDKLAAINFERYQNMELRENLTPALISYEGIQYQYMAPNVFTKEEWEYVQDRLWILSGFYGALRPLDGVTPYRLEMQAKARVSGKKDLYDFWGEKLYETVMRDKEHVIMNLASKEYSQCIEKYLKPKDRFITCIFGERKGDQVIQKGTLAKMARGEMVRFMAGRRIQEPEELKTFDRLDYHFEEKMSTPTEYVFLKGV